MINVFLSIHPDETSRLEGAGRAFDGVEGGFDAIIVEVDFDSLPADERPKRQLSLSGMPVNIYLYVYNLAPPRERAECGPGLAANAKICLFLFNRR